MAAKELFTEVAVRMGILQGTAAGKPLVSPSMPVQGNTSSDDDVVTVSFASEPSGAKVLVDGVETCPATPCKRSIVSKKHQVQYLLEKSDPVVASFTPTPSNNELMLSLKPWTCTLTISAQQAGKMVSAEILVDELVVGNTPQKMTIALRSKVALRYEGILLPMNLGAYANGDQKDVEVQIPLPDLDNDGVPDKSDKCPNAKEDRNGIADTDGCPDGSMAAIPAGCFLMGTKSGFFVSEGESNESPQHNVCLSAFSMDKTEVTRSAYRASQGRNPHENDASCYVWDGKAWSQGNLSSNFLGDDQPQVCVDWNQAKAYCESQGKRLPTEAEFEYANRSGSTAKWQCGNDESCLDRIAWYNANSNNQTHPVGQKQPNAWGLFDMTGNVWEWMGDWYGSDYYGKSPGQDPKGAASGSARVNRGGSWLNDPAGLRSADRLFDVPSGRDSILGFRCVSSAP